MKRLWLLVVSVIFAGIGATLVVVTHADTFAVNSESEQGTVAGKAMVVDDIQASAQKAVRFGDDSTTPPTGTDKPTAANTGVPIGQALTIVNGNQTYSSTTPTTISNKEFRGFIKVTGANITFENCFFRGGNTTGNSALLDTENSQGTITVRDSEFAPMNPSASIDGLSAKNTTLVRVNIHGTVDGLKAGANTLIQDSYIHDMAWFANDPNQGGGSTHNDGVQTLSGSNITLRHNNIDMSTSKEANAAWQVTQDFGLVSNIRAENNWLDGGSCTLNISHKQFGDLSHPLTTAYITGNRFGRHRLFASCAILVSTKVTLAQNSGNVYDDTGTPIPQPDRHD